MVRNNFSKTERNNMKIENTNKAQTIANTIDTLAEQRKAWEHGTYKKSNEELYQLLDNCLTFYFELRGNIKQCKALNAQLDARKITFNASTSLTTRIVRAVFGENCGKRSHAYARVIAVAAAEKSDEISMYDFIVKRNGIEEIRRSTKNGKSPADVRSNRQAFATEQLATSTAIAKPFNVADSKRERDEGATHSLLVAIVREETDGTYSIVYETSTKSVINTALADAGKALKADEAAAESAKNARDDEKGADSAAENAASKSMKKAA